MRIVCPSCSAAYDVPDQLLRGRRAVRCASCAREWQLDTPNPETEAESLFRPEPPPPPPAEEVEAEPVPRRIGIPKDAMARAVAMDRLMTAAPRRRTGAGLVLAWLLSFAVLGAAGWVGYDKRQDIMNAWPPIVRLYALLGLA